MSDTYPDCMMPDGAEPCAAFSRVRGNFCSAVAAMALCLECLEQNSDPDTVAIEILREALYGPPETPNE